MPSEKKKKKVLDICQKGWVGVAIKTKKKVKFYFGQEHREGGAKNSLSKIKKCQEHGESSSFVCVSRG